MIPEVSDDIRADFRLGAAPARTFKLDIENGTIRGETDGAEALMQAVYMILSTKRYEWLIHSWDYGSEVLSLIGRDMHYCIPEAERMIREALLTDDRIRDVRDFRFETEKNRLRVFFTVVSIYGETEGETEVTL